LRIDDDPNPTSRVIERQHGVEAAIEKRIGAPQTKHQQHARAVGVGRQRGRRAAKDAEKADHQRRLADDQSDKDRRRREAAVVNQGVDHFE